MGSAWGSRDSARKGDTENGGGDSPPFIEADDLQGMRPWQNVSVVSIKRDMTNKDDDEKESRRFYWVVYRQVDGEFVHRQAYWGDTPLYRLLKVFDIHEGIDDDLEVRGKELWIKLVVDKRKNAEKDYVKVVGHRTENPLAKKESTSSDNEDKVPF